MFCFIFLRTQAREKKSLHQHMFSSYTTNTPQPKASEIQFVKTPLKRI